MKKETLDRIKLAKLGDVIETKWYRISIVKFRICTDCFFKKKDYSFCASELSCLNNQDRVMFLAKPKFYLYKNERYPIRP